MRVTFIVLLLVTTALLTGNETSAGIFDQIKGPPALGDVGRMRAPTAPATVPMTRPGKEQEQEVPEVGPIEPPPSLPPPIELPNKPKAEP